MTEEQGEMLHEAKNEFYIKFSMLVAKQLAKLPVELEEEAKMHFQESCSVYGSCYDDYLNEYRKLADDPTYK